MAILSKPMISPDMQKQFDHVVGWLRSFQGVLLWALPLLHQVNVGRDTGDAWHDPAAHYDAQAPCSWGAWSPMVFRVSTGMLFEFIDVQYCSMFLLVYKIWLQLKRNTQFASVFCMNMLLITNRNVLCILRRAFCRKCQGHPGRVGSNRPQCACEISILLPRRTPMEWDVQCTTAINRCCDFLIAPLQTFFNDMFYLVHSGGIVFRRVGCFDHCSCKAVLLDQFLTDVLRLAGNLSREAWILVRHMTLWACVLWTRVLQKAL